MTPETIAKIRSHKYNNRKLATTATLARYNKILRNAGPDLKNVLAADNIVVSTVANMNSALNTFLEDVDMSAAAGGATIIEITEITGGTIPTSVWLGKIKLPTGDIVPGEQSAAKTAQATFADEAGKLRSRIARIIDTVTKLNDLGNSNQRPNIGGQVGDPKHSQH